MHHLPLARRVLTKAAGSGVRACMVEILEAKTVATKSGGVKTASTKAVASVETTVVEAAVKAVEAVEAAMETAEAAMAAPAATARRHNVG